MTDYEDLPANAKHFLDRIVELSETPLATISVGPSREQTIILRDPWQG
ncbi:MAG: adenylosuccinate synthetase [Limosilactobacillus fermentum]